MKKIATLKLISYKLDNNSPANEINELLASISDENSDMAKEFNAMLYLRENDLIKAKEEYQKIVASENASDDLKHRALDMINLLSEK